jgi:4-amino-4-deoxy-L-arabinose transferase-like glycosyltransferase
MSSNRTGSPFALQQHRDTPYTKQFLKILIAIIILAIISRLVVATRYQINWDEFHFLAFIYEYLRGDLSVTMQTFHVHLFTWLAHTAENETTVIIIARLIMATLQFACAYFIFSIARQFSSTNAALFAVVSYFSVSYITKTGASFRYDPIASFFLMASLYLIITKSKSLKSLAIAGVCVALALLVTIKSAIYFPSITIIALLLFVTFPLSKDRFIRGFTLLSVAIITFIVLFSLHKSSLSIEDSPAASALEALNTSLSIEDSPAALALEALNKMVNANNLFPRWKALKISLKLDIMFWLPPFFRADDCHFIVDSTRPIFTQRSHHTACPDDTFGLGIFLPQCLSLLLRLYACPRQYSLRYYLGYPPSATENKTLRHH